MDGVRFRTMLLSTLIFSGLSATGCKTTSEPLPSATLPMPGQQKSGLFGFGRSSPQFGPPKEQVAVKSSRKPNRGVKLETEVILAETEVESAMLEGQPDDVRNRLLDDARTKYQKALQADPKNKQALVGLARLYGKAGDREKCVQTYTQAIHLDPKDHETAIKLAKAQAQFGDYAGACQTCEFALKLDPENRGYRKILGFCQANADRWEESFATLLERNVMNEADARVFLARVLYEKERDADCRTQLELALKANPSHQEAQMALADLSNPTPAVGDTNPVRTVSNDGR